MSGSIRPGWPGRCGSGSLPGPLAVLPGRRAERSARGAGEFEQGVQVPGRFENGQPGERGGGDHGGGGQRMPGRGRWEQIWQQPRSQAGVA